MDWAKEQLQKGTSKDDVRQMLKNTGWQDHDIDQMFLEINTPSNSSVPIPPGNDLRFKGPWELSKKSLAIYKERFWPLLGIYLIPAAIFGALILISFVGVRGIVATEIIKVTGTVATVGTFVVILIWILALLVLGGWSMGASLYAIKDRSEKIGIKESYKRSRHLILPMLWLGFITGLAIACGVALLLIPGIIFMIWFLFASQILVSENKRGLEALIKSKEYVRGMWWSVFGRFLFLQVFVLLIPAILRAPNIYALALIANLITALLVPLSAIYTFLVYENLKEIKGVNVVAKTKKGWLVLMSVLGTLFVILVVFWAFATLLLITNSFDNWGKGYYKDNSPEAIQSRNMENIQTKEKLYFDAYDRYTSTLGELTDENNKPISTVDPIIKKNYTYRPTADLKNYDLCTSTPAGSQKCITPETIIPPSEHY